MTAFKAARNTDDFDHHKSFIDLLLAGHDLDSVAWHYNLLRDRSNRDLYLRLRAAFAKRSRTAADFLASRVEVETDREMRLDLLHLLGRMRHRKGVKFAREMVTNEDAEFRERACHIVGWMGSLSDVDVYLRPRLLGDPVPLVRSTSATSLSQIVDRLARAIPRAVRLLYEALVAEADPSVIPWIIISAQYVTSQRFGLKEVIEENDFRGDVVAAKKRCLPALSKLVNT